jgi:competence protein ComEC
VDLRLLPAAAACWGACLVGVRLPPRAGIVLAVLTVIVVGVVLRGPPRRSAAAARPAARHRSPRGHVVLVLLVVGAALGSAGSQRAVRDAGLLAALVTDGAQVRVVGTVRSEPVPLRSTSPWDADRERFRVDLALEHVTGRGRSGPAAARVLVLAGDRWRDVAYGSRVEAFGTLEPTGPGDSARAILVVRGPPSPRSGAGVLDRRVRTVRQALLRVSDGLPADRRGLVPGAAIGDTSRVPDDLDDALRVAGLTHITAVSGAHFAIVGGVVLALTAAFGVPRPARAAVVGLAMAGFVLLVHPAPSVLRAAVTGAVGVAALVLGRPSRAVPALAACVVVLLVVDPWLAGSVGFTLSVTATAGIVLGSGPLARGMTPLVPERAARVVAVPLAAQCACGPVVALLAPGLPTYAVPANLVAAPAVAPATVLGVLAALLAPWWEGGGTACARAAGWATAWIAAVARTAAGLPGSSLPWPAAPWGPLLLAVATAGVVLAVVRPWRRPAAPA